MSVTTTSKGIGALVDLLPVSSSKEDSVKNWDRSTNTKVGFDYKGEEIWWRRRLSDFTRKISHGGPGGVFGVGCGVGVGLGITGALGLGVGHGAGLNMAFGVGAGCGVGVGYGYGAGIGKRFDTLYEPPGMKGTKKKKNSKKCSW
eukprot:CAMPEP_0196581132 /NCGR_PEP_ID=MMETSP1081-20130531/32570_1 /TAXON_ID=36882 /ORGANISM="Pyramimonas amylifera, Strain CCMP720" /LENGTH=144 /DNA_ID=CAMNT_0041901243 /DNA_START=184 /DNA_END=618 /DNA_ORIENTATION=+